jgi:acetate kinase
MFCYRVARHIGSLAAALGGLDAIVFTAGVGTPLSRVGAFLIKTDENLMIARHTRALAAS